MPKRPSIFAKDHCPYGRASFNGDPGHWRQAYSETMGLDEAKARVGDTAPWGILGIEPDSSLAAIRKAFRKLIMENHPDRGGDPEKARDIIAAYETVKEYAI